MKISICLQHQDLLTFRMDHFKTYIFSKDYDFSLFLLIPS